MRREKAGRFSKASRREVHMNGGRLPVPLFRAAVFPPVAKLHIEKNLGQGVDFIPLQLGEKNAAAELVGPAFHHPDNLADEVHGDVILQLDLEAQHLALSVEVLRGKAAAPVLISTSLHSSGRSNRSSFR